MKLLLVSDTHVPARAGVLPAELLERVPHADVVIHAGDWTDTATLDLLQERARRLIGVYGNNDGPQLAGPVARGCVRGRSRTDGSPRSACTA